MGNKRGVALFLFYEGKILLLLRENKPNIECPNIWCVPTGGIEPGENDEETARRECWEELEISPELIFHGLSPKSNGIFSGELTEEEANSIVLGEGQDFGFFTYREVEKLFETGELGGITATFFREKHPVLREGLLRTVFL